MISSKALILKFFDFVETPLSDPEKIDPAFKQYLDLFSSIISESVYVLDVQLKHWSYVSPHAFMLCGYPAEDALNLGYDFFQKIVHSDDLRKWAEMHRVILEYLKDSEVKRDEVENFSCTFRLQRKYSFLKKPLSQMVYQRIKPIWIDDTLRYLICSVASSSAKEAGNLCMNYKDGLTYEEYKMQK